MKTLILFNLKRRFFNKSTIIIFLLQFILIFCFFHLEIFDDEKSKEIYIDSSAKKYHEYFGQLSSDLRYIISDSGRNCKIILHYDKRNNCWNIYSGIEIDDFTLKNIEKDIVNVVKNEYKSNHKFIEEYINEYENMNINLILRDNDNKNNELLIILISCCYFLLLGYGNLISSEIIYEKNMNVLPVILNNMDIKEHFYANIVYGYLVPLLRGVMLLICIGINMLIGGYNNVSNLMNEYVPVLLDNDISLLSFVLAILIILAVLVIVQIIMLLICCGFKNNNQVANFLLILNIIGLLFYYLCLNNLTDTFLQNGFVIVLSYFPIVSMVLMSGRLLLSQCGLISGMIALIANIIFLFFVIGKSTKIYKRNILR